MLQEHPQIKEITQPRLIPFELLIQFKTTVVWLYLLRMINGKWHVLLGRRIGNSEYTFPGGKVDELDESPEAAIVREVGEELLESIGDGELTSAQSSPRYWRENWCGAYFAFARAALPERVVPAEPEKHESWEWVSIQHLIRLALSGKLPLFMATTYWIDILEEIDEADQFDEQGRLYKEYGD